jgi:RNase P subunit RPR2
MTERVQTFIGSALINIELGHYDLASHLLNWAEEDAKKFGIVLPEYFGRLKEETNRFGMEKFLNQSRKSLNSKKYSDALEVLLNTKICEGETEEQKEEIDSLKRMANNIGFEYNLKMARESLSRSNRKPARKYLSIAEHYAKRIDINLPEDFQSLVREAYRKPLISRLADILRKAKQSY